jgi:membrane protease YdiL (CAAX protease family)
LKRLFKFLRSVLPADPSQLIYLIGVVCLYVCPRLPWWPTEYLGSLDHLGRLPSGSKFSPQFILFFLYPTSLAGIVGYFICFWLGKNQARWILLGVCLPSLTGMALFLNRILLVSAPYSSVLNNNYRTHQISLLLSALGKLPPGFHFCVVGLLLVLLFLSRVVLGISRMPLTLQGIPFASPEDSPSWHRVQFLIWVLVGPLFLLMSLPVLLIVAIPQAPIFLMSAWFAHLALVLDGVMLLIIVFSIAGKEGRHATRNCLRLPNTRFVAIALLLPTGISACLPTVQYLVDRTHWAAYEFGKLAPPQYSSYFQFPDPWLLLLGFGALAEEVTFRGLLQPNLIRRYGLYRGIFLTGIVWASIHFRSDHYSHLTDTSIVLQLASRVCICLALGFVLAWLTLWSGSVFPAAITHTISNFLIYSGTDSGVPWSGALRIGLWGVCAFLLFRYWSIPQASAPAPDAPITIIESSM